MDNGKRPSFRRYIKKHKRISVWYRAVLTMAAVVVFVTTYALILPALTLENAADCGIVEHSHTEACYETNLVLTCGLEEGEVPNDETLSDSALASSHVHTADCYAEEKTLTCALPEHTHTDECYNFENETTTVNIEETTASSDGGAGGAPETATEAAEAAEGEEEVKGLDLSPFITAISVAKEEPEEPLVTEDDIANILLYTAINADLAHNLEEQVAGDKLKVSDTAVKYNELTGLFDVELLRIDFEMTAGEILALKNTADGLSFTYELPSDILVSEELISGGPYEGTDSVTGNHIFDYSIVKDDATGKCYIKIDYIESAISALDSSTAVKGFVYFNCSVDANALNSEGNIELNFPGSVTFTIESKDITYPDTSSAKSDIHVTKTGAASQSTNSVTYTINVYSFKGTNACEINLSDYITGLGGDLTIADASIEVTEGTQSIHYYTTYTGDIVYQPGSCDGFTAVSADKYTTTTGSNGEYATITLPALADPGETGYTGSADGNLTASAYQIKYTYTFNELAEGSSYSLGNSISATTPTDDPNRDITVNASTSDISISRSNIVVISKSNSVDNKGADGADITWTIDVQTNTKDMTSLEGAVLTDDMLAQLSPGDITISPADSAYTIHTNTEGAVTDIEFNSGAGEAYTITYTTHRAAAIGDSTVVNSADLTKGSVSYGTNSTANISRSGVGGVTKALQSEAEDADGNLNLTWEITVDVPSGGILAGSTIVYDSMSGTQQYLSYDDITVTNKDFFDSVQAATGQTGWLNKVSNLQFAASQYDNKISYTDILNNPSTYSNSSFGFFQFQVTDDIAYDECTDGKIVFTYVTTIDKSKVSDTTAFKNTINVGGVTAEETYDYKINVVKTDGNGNTDKTTTDKTTLVWIVKVLIEGTSNIENIVVTDEIPKNLSLTKLEISSDGYNYNQAAVDAASQTAGSYGVDSAIDAATGASTVTITNSSGVYIPAGTIYLKYTCQMDESLLVSGGLTDIPFTNRAVVTADGADYGTASQEQEVIIDDRLPDMNPISKTGLFAKEEQMLHYTVNVNANGDITAADGSGQLTLTDTLTYSSSDETEYYIPYQNYTLDPSSVKLYYAEAQVVTNESTGKQEQVLVKTTAVPDSLWTWKFDKSEVYNDYGGVQKQTDYTKILTVTVPDGTPLIFEYDYAVQFKRHKDDGKFNLSNVATLTGTSEMARDGVAKELWQAATIGGGASTSSVSYTIYKVKTGTYNVKIPGTYFDLYEVDASTGTETLFKSDLVTDANGSLILTTDEKGADGQAVYKTNTLYYLVETRAATGYELPDNPPKRYFFFEDKTAENYSATLAETYSTTYNAINVNSNQTVYVENDLKPNTFDILKVDADNSSEKLQGAGFAVYKAADDSQVTTASTNANGLISIRYNAELYSKNTLYYVTETSPPTGYKMPTNPAKYYFYFGDSTATDYDTFVSGIDTALNAVDITEASASVTVTNEKKVVLKVIKKWFAESGSETTKTSGTVNFDLHQVAVVTGKHQESSGGGDKTLTFSIKDEGGGAVAVDGAESTYPAGTNITLCFYYLWGRGSSSKPEIYLNGTLMEDYETVNGTSGSDVYYYYTFELSENTVISGYTYWNGRGEVTVSLTSAEGSGGSSGGGGDTGLATGTVAENKVYCSYTLTNTPWVWSSADLPLTGTYTTTDDSGTEVVYDVTYYYYVVETGASVEGFTFDASKVAYEGVLFADDDGTGATLAVDGKTAVTSGELTIKNTTSASETVTLPETGGGGKIWFTLIGGMLIFLAVFLSVVNKAVRFEALAKNGGEATKFTAAGGLMVILTCLLSRVNKALRFDALSRTCGGVTCRCTAAEKLKGCLLCMKRSLFVRGKPPDKSRLKTKNVFTTLARRAETLFEAFSLCVRRYIDKGGGNSA